MGTNEHAMIRPKLTEAEARRARRASVAQTTVGWVEFFTRPIIARRAEALGLARARPNLRILQCKKDIPWTLQLTSAWSTRPNQRLSPSRRRRIRPSGFPPPTRRGCCAVCAGRKTNNLLPSARLTPRRSSNRNQLRKQATPPLLTWRL